MNPAANPDEGPKTPFYVWAYLRCIPIARRLGYALAIHGSVARDLDLIAVPWTTRAARPEALAEALRDEFGGAFSGPGGKYGQEKPHGRRAWAITIEGGGTYIDLSITPRSGGAS